MSLKNKYNKIKTAISGKNKKLEDLKTFYDNLIQSLVDVNNEKMRLTDDLIRKAKNKKFDDLSDDILSIEKADDLIGKYADEHKKTNKEIKYIEKEIMQLELLLIQLLSDMGYPDNLLKKDLKLLVFKTENPKFILSIFKDGLFKSTERGFEKINSLTFEEGSIKDLFIILTVPHALTERYAEKTAKIIENELNEIGIENSLILGEIHRDSIDLNRKESEDHPFQLKIDKSIKENLDKQIVVLDIHSGSFKTGEPLFLLTVKHFKFLYLMNVIQQTTHADIKLGSDLNYIIERMRRQDIPALLFEFNDNLRRSGLKKIISSLIDAIEQWHNGQYILKELAEPLATITPKNIYSHHPKKKRSVQRFMKIRILEPTPSKWYSIKKQSGSYKIVRNNIRGSSKFITLDIGDLEEKGIQGIAFIRGVPKTISKKIGEKIETKDWRSQAIRIEYKRIGVSQDSPPEVMINKAMKQYEKTIEDFLSNELNKEVSVNIIPKKDKDFKLIIE